MLLCARSTLNEWRRRVHVSVILLCDNRLYYLCMGEREVWKREMVSEEPERMWVIRVGTTFMCTTKMFGGELNTRFLWCCCTCKHDR